MKVAMETEVKVLGEHEGALWVGKIKIMPFYYSPFGIVFDFTEKLQN